MQPLRFRLADSRVRLSSSCHHGRPISGWIHDRSVGVKVKIERGPIEIRSRAVPAHDTRSTSWIHGVPRTYRHQPGRSPGGILE